MRSNKKEKREKIKEILKDQEYLLTPEQRKLPKSKQSQIILGLLSNSKNEKEKTVHENNASVNKSGNIYKSKHVYKKEVFTEGEFERIVETD